MTQSPITTCGCGCLDGCDNGTLASPRNVPLDSTAYSTPTRSLPFKPTLSCPWAGSDGRAQETRPFRSSSRLPPSATSKSSPLPTWPVRVAHLSIFLHHLTLPRFLPNTNQFCIHCAQLFLTYLQAASPGQGVSSARSSPQSTESLHTVGAPGSLKAPPFSRCLQRELHREHLFADGDWLYSSGGCNDPTTNNRSDSCFVGYHVPLKARRFIINHRLIINHLWRGGLIREHQRRQSQLNRKGCGFVQNK